MARALEAPRAAEQRYVAGLRAVAKGVHEAFMAYMEPRLADVAGRKDSRITPHTGSLNAIEGQVIKQIPAKVAPLYASMSLEVRIKNREAAISALGLTTEPLSVQREVLIAREASIRLVENAARAYADDVRAVFEDPDNLGLSVEELKAKLLERGNVSESRAELIARDQTLKLNGAINQARQVAAGVTEYTWSTSGDDRVRETHRALEGQRFAWDSPPEPGHPGQDFQCRCIPIPFIEDLDGI